MSCVRDMGKIMNQHHALQSESCPGRYTPMRNCKGACRMRRSYTQFDGASIVCKKCVLRTPAAP